MAGLELWYTLDRMGGRRTAYRTTRLNQWGFDNSVVGSIAEDIVREHIESDEDVADVYRVYLFESDEAGSPARYEVPVYTKKVVVCASGVVERNPCRQSESRAVSCSIWFSLGDKNARRGEFVCDYVCRFPTDARRASMIVESILETQDLVVDDDVIRVYLFPDNDPETKPVFARDVQLAWTVTYDTQVVEEFENDA